MPTYEFFCKTCKKTFEVILSISEHEKKSVRCPKCKGKKVSQQVASFQAITSKKS